MTEPIHTSDAAYDEARHLWTVTATDATGNSARVVVGDSEIVKHGSLRAAAAKALEAVLEAKEKAGAS